MTIADMGASRKYKRLATEELVRLYREAASVHGQADRSHDFTAGNPAAGHSGSYLSGGQSRGLLIDLRAASLGRSKTSLIARQARGGLWSLCKIRVSSHCFLRSRGLASDVWEIPDDNFGQYFADSALVSRSVAGGQEQDYLRIARSRRCIEGADWSSGSNPGPRGIAAFADRIRTAFPDTDIVVEDAFGIDDKVAARWSATMTHSGDGVGVPATGKRVTITGMSIARIVDGKIVEGWDNWDRLAMLEQIGAYSPPEAVILAKSA